MAVAPPHDASVRPVFAQAFGHVLDDTPDLRALGRARRTKDGDNRGAARDIKPQRAVDVVTLARTALTRIGFGLRTMPSRKSFNF